MADVGTSSSVTFATSGFTGEFLNLSVDGVSRPAIDTTHLGSSNWRTFIPGKLTDPGTLQAEIAHDPNVQPPINGAAETVTITFPVPAGLTNGATLAGSAFLTDYAPGVPLEERMTANVTFKFSSALTFTDAS